LSQRLKQLIMIGNDTGRPFGHHPARLLLCACLFFYYRISAQLPPLPQRRLDKERRRRQETCSLYSVRRRSPRLLLLRRSPRCSCSAARSAVDGHPSLLLFLLHRVAPLLPAAASALRPVSPDDASTAAPTGGDCSLGRQLASEAASQGEASAPPTSPPAIAAAPRCRRRRRLHRDTMHVASIHFKCFRFFRGMLQAFNKDVAKVDRDVAHVAMGYTYMF